MLRFESGGDSTSGINLLNLNYAKMDPVRSIFAIPIDERVKLIGRYFCDLIAPSLVCVISKLLLKPALSWLIK